MNRARSRDGTVRRIRVLDRLINVCVHEISFEPALAANVWFPPKVSKGIRPVAIMWLERMFAKTRFYGIVKFTHDGGDLRLRTLGGNFIDDS